MRTFQQFFESKLVENDDQAAAVLNKLRDDYWTAQSRLKTEPEAVRLYHRIEAGETTIDLTTIGAQQAQRIVQMVQDAIDAETIGVDQADTKLILDPATLTLHVRKL